MKGTVRSPVVAWLPIFIPGLSLFYLMYYKYTVINELKGYLGDESLNPIMDAVVLPLVTCGLYNFYLPFKLGGLVQQAQQKAGMSDAENQGMTFLLFMFLCSSHLYKLQGELNKVWEA